VIDASGISPEVVDEFCGTVRAKSGSSKPTARTLGCLVGYLDGLGVLAAPVPLAAPSPEEELVDRCRRYVTAERGVEPETVVTYLRPIRVSAGS
jgi:hypothetical protein